MPRYVTCKKCGLDYPVWDPYGKAGGFFLFTEMCQICWLHTDDLAKLLLKRKYERKVHE